jgi:hypothetical protein
MIKKEFNMKMNKLFVLTLSGFLLLMSCGKPTDPESLNPVDESGGYKIVKKFPTFGFAQDLVKKDSMLYISQGEGGLMVVNVADPLNPLTVSMTTENLQGYSNKISIKDSLVYMAAGSNGVFVVDVINPEEPYRLEVSCPYQPARNLHILENLLFIANSENGVIVLDISFPYDIIYLGKIPTAGYAYGVTTTSDGHFLLAACGELGLSVFNISGIQQSAFSLAGWCDTPGYAEAVTISDNDDLAFIACGTAGLQFVDYSDTTNIHITGSFDGGGYAKELIYRDKVVYMTTELNGLQVIDVSNVAAPRLIGKIDTELALGLDIDDKYIYLAGDSEGLIIISKPD